MNSTATIFARLAAVAPSLAAWNGAPAIFNETVPDDFLDQEPKPSKPFLIIAVPTSDVAMETFVVAPCSSLEGLRVKARVAKRLIPPITDTDNDWHDTAALTVIDLILSGGAAYTPHASNRF